MTSTNNPTGQVSVNIGIITCTLRIYTLLSFILEIFILIHKKDFILIFEQRNENSLLYRFVYKKSRIKEKSISCDAQDTLSEL